jgi:uncharacterized membrane protein
VLGFVLPVFTTPPSESLMRSALVHMWPNLVAYFLSFSVIGIMWHNHHALFRMIERIDRRTVFYNLMLLAVTAFIPFATSLLGAYPTMRPTTFLYGLTLTAASTAYNAMLNHLVGGHAFSPEVGAQTIRGTIFAYRVGWITYGVAMLVSLVAPLVSFGLYVAITIFYLIPRGLDTDVDARTS